MRIVLTNFGTTGDIQPFLALAVELRRQGHEATMAFAPNFASRVQKLGLPFLPIGPDLQATQGHINRAWQIMPQSAEQMQAILAPVTEALPQAFEELRSACRQADALVSGPAQPAGRMIHELTGIPFVSVQLSNFGGTGSPALQQASAALINPFRASLGLPPLRNPLTIDANSPQLALYAISSHILPRPADWPSHYHLTGYFFLDDARETVEPALEAFIAAGERPVVITFGSMAGENPEKMLHLFLEAVQLSGCRAVIQQNWHGRAIPALPPTVYLADYVPHTWLLSKASCIVHHGGGGTAGAVFRSGVPSVFVPHGQIFDQFYFALLAEEAGCAGPALPYTELTAERLAKAIVNTRRTPRYDESAAALGEKIQAERGVQKARALVEALVERIGLSGQVAEQTSDFQQRTSKINQRKKFQQEQRAKRSHYDEYKNDL